MYRLFIIFSMFFYSHTIHASDCSPLLDFDVRTLGDRQPVNLCQAYQGKVLLIVNTASKCAYTDQYDSLERLYREYKDKGLVVLGFPSNDFGAQEPGTEKQIKSFCRLTYGVEFPMFEKTHASKRNPDPIYKSLAKAAGEYPAWNFHKYLIDREGKFVASFKSAIDPYNDAVISRINNLL